ncbi:hypothetical protein AGMMS49531_09420 [Endomicrobiia bacterium]|nr:hypothetical protein AGMMS49531_09420 [Endomicrobiia bacterium]
MITALADSGLSTYGFVFCGFLKRKHVKIRKELSEFLNLEKTVVFYESPRRILKTVEICLEVFSEDAEFASQEK